MEFRLPELGEGVYEAEFTEWRVKAGDQVQHGQVLGDVLTDKASMELPSPFSGSVTRLLANPGEIVHIGQAVLEYDPQQEGAESGDLEPPAENAPSQQHLERSSSVERSSPSKEVRAAPSVRRMARELNVDLESVTGSGPGGRVLVSDIAKRAHGANNREPPTSTPRDKEVAFGRPGQRIKLAGVRRKIAEQMSLSKQTIPHYSLVEECDVTELVKLRESLKGPLAAKGVRVTYLAFFLKAAAGALRDVPLINSSLDEEAEEITLHESCHIGIAVAAPAGLIVPVVKNADRLSLIDIAREIERLANSARTNRMALEDLRDGGFTVTSIGNIGGLISTPIINPPQTAIMGVGRIVRRPAYDVEGNIRPADVVYLSFSFDHRVIDGAIGTAFSNAVKRRLESPAEMLVSP